MAAGLVEHKDDKVATCASCHTPHSIRPASDPQSSVNPTHVEETCGRCHANATYMAPYGIPTDQLALYKQSVHWHTLKEVGDLSAPSCNDCHGNHGAAPPGIDSVGNVCGQCHAVQGDLYRGSRHATIFKDIGMPGCATCHRNHDVLAASDSLLGVGEGAACSACHSADDANGKAAMEMRALLESLRTEHEAARDLLLRAERSGIEVSQAQFDLNGAFDALVKGRAAIHNFTVVAVRTPVDDGRAIAARAHERGIRALEEFSFRRRGLAVSILIILTLIAALVMKIRQIERPLGSVSSGPTFGRPSWLLTIRAAFTNLLRPAPLSRSLAAAWSTGCWEPAPVGFFFQCSTRSHGTSFRLPLRNPAWPA